ncbi:MAG: hypothetical protein II707_00945 [Spirochaetales bacterium]|jgi:2-keto-3-deoxy-L-rhamnonate aldolase RhmA|nr:hypothetical protein [Spirochaetales bacterium]MBQ3921832.1 hypothetical protein [Spirochaetales bacterium]
MKTLRKELQWLKDKYSIVGVKGGTEIEAMSFDDIDVLRAVSDGILPMTVKIGGAEARNDIDYMMSIGVDTILAPMIESPYALRNFVKTMEAMDKQHICRMAVNIETIFAYNNLTAIFAMSEFEQISSVTVGRTDLSGSLGMNVDSDRVTEITADIVRKAKSLDKMTSVGGKIMPDNAELVKNGAKPTTINTRHIIIDTQAENITESVYYALMWERDFYLHLRNLYPLRQEFYNLRMMSIENRINYVDYHHSPVNTPDKKIVWDVLS